MGISERRLKEKEKLRDTILKTAWEMVKEEGWQSLSIRKIADAIDFSVPVIYDYFESKEAILEEFAREGAFLLTKSIKQAKEKHGDPVEQLKAMALAYWDFALRNKEYYRLMFGVGMACCENCQCFEGAERFDSYIIESISTLLKKNRKTKVEVCLKYHTYTSILHGLVSIKLTGSTPAPDELNKLVLEDAVDGFIKNLT
jgi:AcrR family transcriptional regulator